MVLATMALFGIMDGLQKFLTQRYPPLEVLWIRYLLSVPLAFLIVGRRGGGRHLFATRKPWLQLWRTLLIVVEMLMVLWAFRMLPLADAHAVLAVTPLVVTALSVPLLGERADWARWLAVGFGFAGVLVILRPGFGVVSPWSLLVLLATLLYSLYQILTRIVGRTDRVETSFFIQFVVGAVVLCFIAPWVWTTPDLVHWPLFLTVAGLGAAGHLLFIRALQIAPAVVLQPFTYTLLLWAVVVGWVAFGDWPDMWVLLGAGMVVGAGLFTAWRDHALRRAG